MSDLTSAPETTTRKLSLTRADLLKPTMWECTGKSPGNTPTAKLQAAQMFLQMLANPQIAQQINVRALLRLILNEGPLKNASDVLKSDAEIAQDQAQQQAQQQQQQQQMMQAQMAQAQMKQNAKSRQQQPAGPIPAPNLPPAVSGGGNTLGMPSIPAINGGGVLPEQAANPGSMPPNFGGPGPS